MGSPAGSSQGYGGAKVEIFVEIFYRTNGEFELVNLG